MTYMWLGQIGKGGTANKPTLAYNVVEDFRLPRVKYVLKIID